MGTKTYKQIIMTYNKYDNAPTLSETMAKLRKEGYTEDFNLGFNCILCNRKGVKVFPTEFHIDQFFRFEGESDPSDSSILYAISSEKHKLKGTLVNGYGIYSEPMADEMIQKLKTH